MKMINLKQLILLSSALFIATSCEDYLTEVNPNEVQQTEYYSSLEETESGLTAVYAVMRIHELMNIQYEQYRNDMAWPGYGRPAPLNETYSKWYYHEYDNSTSEIQGKWEALYLGIFRANQVIEGLETLRASGALDDESSMQRYNEQMGQAKFFRGLFHHYLSVSYRHTDGNCAIIVDKVPDSVDDYYKPLSSPEDVRAFARNDLKEAYELLPAAFNTDETISTGEGRVTAATAATILGNSYLLNNEIDSAMYYYEDVITNAAYGLSLETNFDNFNTEEGEFNSESIFEISYSANHNTELTAWVDESMTHRLAFAFDESTLPSAWIAYDWSNEPVDESDDRNYYDSIPSLETGESYTMLRQVPRRCSAMIAVVNDIHTSYFADDNTTNNLLCNAAEGGYGVGVYRHYTQSDQADGEKSNWFTGKNIIVNRLSEVYINYAECLIQKDRLEEGVAYLNKIRSRWALKQIVMGEKLYADKENDYNSKEDLMNHIMYIEKPLELSVEGYETRWIDMRRWGVVEDRFADLADRTYYTGHFAGAWDGADGYAGFIKNGVALTQRWNSMLSMEPFADIDYDESTLYTIDYEYDKTALQIVTFDKNRYNYYYPIPLNEIQTNTAISY